MQQKGINNFDETLLDLCIGLTKYNPAERLSLDQIKTHAWMLGNCVDETEFKSHFASKVPSHRLSQKSTLSMNSNSQVNRGNSISIQYGPGKDEMTRWEEDKLKYKKFADDDQIYNPMLSFFSNVSGFPLFEYLWMYLRYEEDVSPEVDSKYWKMNFVVQ